MKSLKDFNYLLSLDRRYTKTESEIFRLLAMFEFGPSAVSPTTASADFPTSIPPPCGVGSHRHWQGSPRVSHMRF